MLSISKYLIEQNMDINAIQQARGRLLMAKGFGRGTPVAAPSAIAGPESVAAPTVVKKTLSTVAGPTEISADDWAGKFGGAAKKVVQTAIESK